MKHKHADLIHAWADGAEIQFKRYGEWLDDLSPDWYDSYEYRIKPEEKKPVVRWLWASKDGSMSAHLHTEDERSGIVPDYTVKLEWSRTEFPE